ncbi:MarR family winged helix-turn-helix transcriptional regulator [Tumebacillus flagellatus]|uniref:MarR family transcriptional regulator n=1 Tax=Tumebacillus flagellatus TaxID=1157490 RepID=A0A074MGQ8_9BACL|nr:MarR family transcriptional regulator [Tumebacillus flagellatus]KEO84912.1 MarR family transcriptional regulator [Tumebacillus flagellatus]
METLQLKPLIARYMTASFNVNRIMSARLGKLMPENLTADQHQTLCYIHERGMCTSSELADTFFVGKSSITAIVKRLVEKDLIERIPDERDRRVTYLALTPSGKQLMLDVQLKIEQLLARYIGHFQETEILAFIETFEKLARLLISEEEEVTENS